MEDHDALLFVAFCAGPGPARCRRDSRGAVVSGAAAPGFTITDTSGKAVRLADYSGKYVVLEWTNPECPFVRKHYSSGNMQGLQKEWGAKDVVWLSINSTNATHSEFKTPREMSALDARAGRSAHGHAARSTSGTGPRLRRQDDAAHVRRRPGADR